MNYSRGKPLFQDQAKTGGRCWRKGITVALGFFLGAGFGPPLAGPGSFLRGAAPEIPSIPVQKNGISETLPIDLPTALSLVNTANPTVALARERVQEALARQREAEVLWLPNLQAGPAYLRHDGQIQNSRGDIFGVSKSNFFMGGGTYLRWDTGSVFFEPLVARRLTRAESAQAQSVSNNVQLDVALTYLDLLQAHAQLAINS
jgi:outer membrane protein TolC